MLLEEVIPAIKAKWPDYACKTIWLQQDNARPHISATDPDFIREATKDGWDIHLINQPAQSPDLNILDLGFFRAIQSIKDQMSYKDEDKLIEVVKSAYDNYDPILLNYIWLSLQNCMIEIMDCKGNNNYQQPHMGKARMDNEGTLPQALGIEQDLIDECKFWVENGSMENYQPKNEMKEYQSDSDVDFAEGEEDEDVEEEGEEVSDH